MNMYSSCLYLYNTPICSIIYNNLYENFKKIIFSYNLRDSTYRTQARAQNMCHTLIHLFLFSFKGIGVLFSVHKLAIFCIFIIAFCSKQFTHFLNMPPINREQFCNTNFEKKKNK